MKHHPQPDDPLREYPDMMSVSDLMRFFGCSYNHAKKLMRQLPHVDISGGSLYAMLRTPKNAIRRQYLARVEAETGGCP